MSTYCFGLIVGFFCFVSSLGVIGEVWVEVGLREIVGGELVGLVREEFCFKGSIVWE